MLNREDVLFYSITGYIHTVGEIIDSHIKQAQPQATEEQCLDLVAQMIEDGMAATTTQFSFNEVSACQPILSYIEKELKLQAIPIISDDSKSCTIYVANATQANLTDIQKKITLERIAILAGGKSKSTTNAIQSIPGSELASTTAKAILCVGKEVLKGIAGVGLHVAGAGISSVYLNTRGICNNLKNSQELKTAITEFNRIVSEKK